MPRSLGAALLLSLLAHAALLAGKLPVHHAAAPLQPPMLVVRLLAPPRASGDMGASREPAPIPAPRPARLSPVRVAEPVEPAAAPAALSPPPPQVRASDEPPRQPADPMPGELPLAGPVPAASAMAPSPPQLQRMPESPWIDLALAILRKGRQMRQQALRAPPAGDDAVTP